jgi:hypothetical protein
VLGMLSDGEKRVLGFVKVTDRVVLEQKILVPSTKKSRKKHLPAYQASSIDKLENNLLLSRLAFLALNLLLFCNISYISKTFPFAQTTQRIEAR